MLRVGLTGGIGCGKSVVADMFRELGITVIDADQISHQLVEPGSPVLNAVIEQFGKDFLDAEGGLDRQKMAQHVFADPEKKKALESLIHPAVREAVSEQLKNCSKQAYVIIAVPLLLETGAYTELTDRVLVVDCDEALQIQRVQQRDGRDKEQIQNIIGQQINRSERLLRADDILYNSTGLDELKHQVAELHQRYLDAST